VNTSLREAEVHVALSRLYMKLAANKKNDEEAAAGDTSAACTPNKPPQPVPDNSAEKHEKAKRGGNILKLALKDMAYIITISNASLQWGLLVLSSGFSAAGSHLRRSNQVMTMLPRDINIFCCCRTWGLGPCELV
jgi:hypothetical protein